MEHIDSDPPFATVFQGVDADEAERFIRAVRQRAFLENKDDDGVWMARYATTRLQGRAMRWHAGLDSAVKMDWELLVQAILREWSTESRADSDVMTTGSAR